MFIYWTIDGEIFTVSPNHGCWTSSSDQWFPTCSGFDVTSSVNTPGIFFLEFIVFFLNQSITGQSKFQTTPRGCENTGLDDLS